MTTTPGGADPLGPDMLDAYQERLDFLYGRLNYEWSGMPRLVGELRISRMRRLLKMLGDPQDALKIVHVAGTKGKGSTATMFASAFSASGIRTGLFCSPHIHRLEERFTVEGKEATPEELIELTDAVRPTIEELDERWASEQARGPTFFEMTTAMGLLHFARRKVGAVVLEVGLGGRLDSTNAIHPELAVITSISFDHTKQLGNTLAAIAFEKAGILKRGVPAVSGVTLPEPRDVIRSIADRRRCDLREVERDFAYEYEPPRKPLRRPSAGKVTVSTWRTNWGPLELPLFGPHQARNAAVALAGIDILAEQGWNLSREGVLRGFSGLASPARIEVLGEAPWLVVDGAHNVASAEALAATLLNCFPEGSRTLVFGTTKDKDLPGQLRALLPHFDSLIATRYHENPRSVPPEEIREAIRQLDGREATLAVDPSEALAKARENTPKGGLICVTGSLFLAAETRALLLKESANPNAIRAVS